MDQWDVQCLELAERLAERMLLNCGRSMEECRYLARDLHCGLWLNSSAQQPLAEAFKGMWREVLPLTRLEDIAQALLDHEMVQFLSKLIEYRWRLSGPTRATKYVHQGLTEWGWTWEHWSPDIVYEPRAQRHSPEWWREPPQPGDWGEAVCRMCGRS
jgi:hypothetical protein